LFAQTSSFRANLHLAQKPASKNSRGGRGKIQFNKEIQFASISSSQTEIQSPFVFL
jgi:hypothetical protein